MRLKEFNKEKEWRKLQRRLYWNKPIIILSSMVVILLIIFLYQSFAIYEVKQTFNIINAKVGTFTKVGGNGTLQLAKNFGGSDYDDFVSVILTSDGGYVAVGGSYSTDGDLATLNKGDYDAIIVKYK